MSIVLDTREHALITLFTEPTVQQLPVGDAWILNTEGQTVLVIERKTTSDFEASFLDGRYREQRTRLLAYCAEHKAKALYIFEGGLDGRRHKLERPALQKLAHRLMLRYGISVWSTKDTEDTSATLRLLADQIKDDPKVFDGETLSYTDVQHVTKKANRDDPVAFMSAALQGCPGVSAKAASAIQATYPTFSALLVAEEKQLATLKVGERKLGPAVAKRLMGLVKPQQPIANL
jgi:ERCC4-type nuclease